MSTARYIVFLRLSITLELLEERLDSGRQKGFAIRVGCGGVFEKQLLYKRKSVKLNPNLE